MISNLQVISISEWFRIALVFSHVVLCAFALTAVLRTDLKLLLGNFTRSEVKAAASLVTVLLFALWGSGLAIIYVDTGFSLAVLATKAKLLLKLLCVSTLTINGIVLHHISFPILMRDSQRITRMESFFLVVTGGLSTSHWMLAAFVGMSAPLGRLPFEILLAAYVVFVALVVVASLFFAPIASRISIESQHGEEAGQLR